MLSRLLGFYRLLLPHLIGAEGVGLYQMAYPVYAVALALSTGGLPVAVSRLVAEKAALRDDAGARRILYVSLAFLAPLGLLGAVVLYLLAPWLAVELGRDPRATLSLRAIAPAILFVTVMSAWRGYFQGYQDMGPTALSQLSEQAVRVATILVLVLALRPLGVAEQAAGATFGAVTGALAGLFVLLALDRGRRRGEGGRLGREPASAILARLVALAVPVAAAGLLPALMQLIDLALVPGRLSPEHLAGASRTSVYGTFAGYALPVASLPAIVTMALAVAVIPAVTEALAQGDRARAARQARAALRTAALVALPAALGAALLPGPLLTLFFGSPAGEDALQALAWSVAFLGLLQTVAGALQGAGLPLAPVRAMLFGLFLKAVLTWFAVPRLGVVGAGYATSLGYLLILFLNLRTLGRALPGAVAAADLVAPFGGLLFMGLTLVLLRPDLGTLLGPRLGTLVLVLVGAATYLLGLLLTGALGRAELALLPGGQTLARVLMRLRLLQ